MRKVTLRNSFHGTSINVVVDSSFDGKDIFHELTERGIYQNDDNAKRRANRIRKELCGVSGCLCMHSFVYEVEL